MITKDNFINSVDERAPPDILKLWLRYLPYLNEYGFVNKSYTGSKLGQYNLKQDSSEYGREYLVYITFNGTYKHSSYDLRNYSEFYSSKDDLLYVPRIDIILIDDYFDSYEDSMRLRKEIAGDWRLDLWNYGHLKSKIDFVFLSEDRDKKREESRKRKRERASSSRIKFLPSMEPNVYLLYSKYDRFLTKYNFQSIYEDQNVFQVKRDAREYGFSYVIQIAFLGTVKYITPLISIVKAPSSVTDEQEKEVLDDWADDLTENYRLNVQVTYRHGNSGNWYDRQRKEEEDRQSYWKNWKQQYEQRKKEEQKRKDDYRKQREDDYWRDNKQRSHSQGTYETEWWKMLEFNSIPYDFNFVKKRYRELMMKYHPDRNGNSKESEEKTKKINDAYDKAKQYYRMG